MEFWKNIREKQSMKRKVDAGKENAVVKFKKKKGEKVRDWTWIIVEASSYSRTFENIQLIFMWDKKRSEMKAQK